MRLEGGEGGVRQSARGHTSISSLRPSEDGHMSREMDGEASVNECENHAGSPCFSGSEVSHLSVTICDGVCV